MIRYNKSSRYSHFPRHSFGQTYVTQYRDRRPRIFLSHLTRKDFMYRLSNQGHTSVLGKVNGFEFLRAILSSGGPSPLEVIPFISSSILCKRNDLGQIFVIGLWSTQQILPGYSTSSFDTWNSRACCGGYRSPRFWTNDNSKLRLPSSPVNSMRAHRHGDISQNDSVEWITQAFQKPESWLPRRDVGT